MRLQILLLLWIGLSQASVWHQTTWHGGAGQQFYTDTTKYLREEGIVDDTVGELSLVSGWRRITTLPQTRVIYDMIEDVNHTVWVATSDSSGKGKVFKSSDAGKTWEETSPLPKAKEVRCLLPFGNIILASGICEDDSARIYKTSDGGKTWISQIIRVDKGAIRVVASKIFSIKLYGRTLYATGSSQDEKGVVFATEDIENLRDWMITGPGIRGSKVYDIEFFPPKNILFASTDGGEIYAYDPDVRFWRLEQRLPLAKNIFTLSSYKNRLFAGASCVDNTARVYSMIEGEWRISKPLSYAGAVLDIIGFEDGGTLYLFTGTAGSDSVARIFFSQEPYTDWIPFGDVFGPATRIEALTLSLSFQNFLAGSAPDGGIYLLGHKESGYLESSRYVITPKVVYDSIRWDCSGEEAMVKVRTLPDSFPATEPSWSNCPYLQNGQSLKGVANINKGEGFVDYRIELLSPSASETPIFKEISIYYHLDTIPPDNPAVVKSDENHPLDSISYDPVITMRWSKGSDPNGIRGYAVSFDDNPSSIPDTSLLITDTSFTDTLSSGEWWFHLITCDSLGNWTESAVNRGPYRIIVDTTTLRLSLDFNPDTCYIGDTVEVEVTTSKILSPPYRESLAVELTPEGLPPETLFALPKDNFTYLLDYPTANKNPGEVRVRVEAEDMAGHRGEAEGVFLILALPAMELLPKDSIYPYPNPAPGDSICIRYFLSEKAKVTITLYTMDGFKIDEFSSDNEPGINRRWFSISQLPNDVYIFRVSAQGESRNGKVIKRFAVLR